MLIGAHVSTSGGYPKMMEYALEVGCECIQIFAKSPRQWAAKQLDAQAAHELVGLRQAAGDMPLYTHTAYLINLATDDVPLAERSVEALADELVRGGILRASGVITHLGNHPAKDTEAAASRVAERIVRAFEAADDAGSMTRLLLENSAGAGTGFGCQPLHFQLVADALPAEIGDRVGICVDTCHAHAYGEDLSTAEAWDAYVTAMEAGGLVIEAIHANDCLSERGSKRDRHAWIGEGTLGKESFEAMMRSRRLRATSVITEMPGEVPEKDAVNIERLAALRDGVADGT